MEYKVLKNLTIKLQGVEQIIQPGTVITITEGQAARLVEAGKVAPIRTGLKEDQAQDPVQKLSLEAESQEMGSSQTAKGDLKLESGRSEQESFQKKGSQSVQEELWERFEQAVNEIAALDPQGDGIRRVRKILPDLWEEIQKAESTINDYWLASQKGQGVQSQFNEAVILFKELISQGLRTVQTAHEASGQ